MAKRFLSYIDALLKLRAEGLAGNIRRVRATIEQSIADQEESIKKAAAGMDEEERTDFFNESADQQMLWADAAQFTNRAMFIGAYAHFEDALKRICKHCIKLGLTIETVKLKSFHINHAKEFLERIAVGSVTFAPSAFGAPWNEINIGWRLLRNNLVHDGGVLDFSWGVQALTDDAFTSKPDAPEESADAPAIRTFLNGRSDAREQSGELVLESRATERFLNVAGKAIEEIMTELDRIAPNSPPDPIRRAR